MCVFSVSARFVWTEFGSVSIFLGHRRIPPCLSSTLKSVFKNSFHWLPFRDSGLFTIHITLPTPWELIGWSYETFKKGEQHVFQEVVGGALSSASARSSSGGKRDLVWFWLLDTGCSLGLTFWCAVHNGLISTHLDVWKKRKFILKRSL